MPPIRNHGLPPYANRAGDPCFPPPYVVDQAGMDIFICDGDPGALQQMIDEALNAPTDRQYQGRRRLRFELADSRVGFACIDVKKLLSGVVETTGVPSLAGLPGVTSIYARQTEVAVMVQIRDEMDMPYWYLPYVLNNLPTAVTTGREIYGYPKQHAAFTSSSDPEKPAQAPTQEQVLFGPNRNWTHEAAVQAFDIRLPPENGAVEFAMKDVLKFHVRGPGVRALEDPPPRTTPRPSPDDFEFYSAPGAHDIDQLKAARSDPANLVPPPGALLGPAVGDAADEFLQRIKSDVPYVFLRQFRDPEVSELASYQAVVIGRLVPNSMDKLRSAEPDFTLVMPWAYNLALAKQIFGWTQKVADPLAPEPDPTEAPVIGLLTGADTTFDVPRAALLWQFDWDRQTSERAFTVFRSWRDENRLRNRDQSP